MKLVLLLVLVGLICSIDSIPVPNFGGHLNKIRDTLQSIHEVRSALKRSIEKREAEINSKASSVVRGLELLSETKRNTGFLGNALHAVKKSVELARRHIDAQKRNNEDQMVLRAVANKIKEKAEEAKRKRNLEVASEFYRRGLFGQAVAKRNEDTKAMLREATEKIKRAVENAKRKREAEEEEEKKKREEDNKILREITEKLKRAVAEVEQKKKREAENKVLRDVTNSIKQAVEKAKRAEKRSAGGFLNNALNMLQRSADISKRNFDEDTAASRAVSENVKRTANFGFFENAINTIKKSAEKAKRHIEVSRRNEAQERVFREVARRMEREHEKHEESKRALRSLVDKVKKAADAFQQKEMMKTREEGNAHAREVLAAGRSALQKKSSTTDEDWKRKVREVLDNKLAQLHVARKRYLEGALPGQVSDPVAKRSKMMGRLGVKYNSKYHPSGSL